MPPDLKELLVTGPDAEALREQAAGLPAVRLNARTLSDLELLAIGGYTPLDGFMTQHDYRGVVHDMRLTSGEGWSMPITLAVTADEAASINEGSEVALADEAGNRLAVMQVAEKFGYEKDIEAQNVFRTEEEAHPGVAALYAQGEVLLGGPLKVFEVPGHDVGDSLDVAVGVHRPDRARDERVVIEHAQAADPHVFGVVVFVEAEVPAGPEPATVDVVDLAIAADGDHRLRS